ncbi:MAG: hypothetical protein QOI81_1725 [Actinomycetota bacterium]|jgi:hypothetical protein|nr:hypothetical protein [Actinomycetota bacterium]
MLGLRCIRVVVLADVVYAILFVLRFSAIFRAVGALVFLIVGAGELLVSGYRVYPDKIEIRVLRKTYQVRRDAVVRISVAERRGIGGRLVYLVTARGDRQVPGLAVLPFSLGRVEVTRQVDELKAWLAERDRRT